MTLLMHFLLSRKEAYFAVDYDLPAADYFRQIVMAGVRITVRVEAPLPSLIPVSPCGAIVIGAFVVCFPPRHMRCTYSTLAAY